ncbi:MAG: hypothetical protein KBS60_07350, partial [Phascolarctobacterium sp.]|nr:hypothetical protein [Candidatus Phascolarctobacterium caballi]
LDEQIFGRAFAADAFSTFAKGTGTSYTASGNITLDQNIGVMGKANKTINLNSKTITGNGKWGIRIDTANSLTIKSGTLKGFGVTNWGRGGVVWVNNASASATFQSVTFDGNKTLYSGCAIGSDAGTVTINGCTFKNHDDNTGHATLMMCNTTTTWNFTGTNTFSDTNNGGYNLDMWATVAATANFSGTTNMNNGIRYVTNNQKVNVNSGATLTVGKMQMLNSTSNLTNAGTVNISGGKLIGTITNSGNINFKNTTTVSSAINTSSALKGSITVSGGLYSNSQHIYSGAAISVTGGTFKTNLDYIHSPAQHGLIQTSGGEVRIIGGTVTSKENKLTGYGGAVRGWSTSKIIFESGTTTFNKGSDTWATTDGKGGAIGHWTGSGDGGIYINSGATVNFTSNTSSGIGGAVWINQGIFQVSGTAKFTGNKQKNGGSTLNANDIYGDKSDKINLYGTVSMDGGIAGDSTGTVTIGNGSTANTVTMTSVAGITGHKTININAKSTLDMSGSSGNISNATSFTNAGTLKTGTGTYSSALSNSGTLTFAKAGTLSGKLTNSGTANISAGAVTGGIANSGTVTVSGGEVKTGAVTNTGTFNVTNGKVSVGVTNNKTMSLNGTGTVSGGVTIGAGATYTVTAGNQTGAVTNNGTFNVTNGKVSGTVTNNNTMSLNGTGTISGAVTIGTAGTYTITKGTQTGLVTNNKTFTINGGAVSAVTNNAAGTVTVANGSYLVNSGTFTNNGIVNYTAGTLSRAIVNNKTLNVAAGTLNAAITGTGGITNINGTVTSNANNANAVITKASAGKLTVSAGNITGAVTNNSGATITVGGGTISGSINNTGTATLNSGAVSGVITNNAAGVFTLGNAAVLTGSNTFTNNGTINMNSGVLSRAIVNNKTLNVSAGTINGAITGTGGTTFINGTVVSRGNNANAVVTNGTVGKLTVSAGTITGAVTNNSAATITVNGGVIAGNLTNNSGGTVTITSGRITNATNNGTITSIANGFSGTITNNSNLYLNAGNLTGVVAGAGGTTTVTGAVT